MTESNGTVMREAVFNEYVAVESAHLLDGKHADRTEGTSGNGQYFAVSNVAVQMSVGSGLQTEKGNLARDNVAFQRSVRYFYGKGAGHDELMLHRGVA